MADTGQPEHFWSDSGRLSWLCGVIAIAFCVALFVALLAFELQQLGIAPAIVFPLLVGAAAGGGLLAAERLVGMRLQRGRWYIAALCAVVAVVGQEAIGYVKVQRPQEAARLSDPRLELFRDEGFAPEPTSFAGYLASHVRDEPVWWTLDFVLAVVGGLGVVRWAAAARGDCRGSEPVA